MKFLLIMGFVTVVTMLTITSVEAKCEDAWTWCQSIVKSLGCEKSMHYEGNSNTLVKDICPETCDNCPA